VVTYKNILYCTDFSESAKAALPFAIDITTKYGGALHVVHVYRDPEHVAEYEISSQVKMDWIRLAQSLGTETEKKLSAL
jgi:nucleotide-binding universal stress UspA family protein